MPALDPKIVEDLQDRLSRLLRTADGFDEVRFLDSGASAAVFRVRNGGVLRAVKVFDPELFKSQGAAAERRRLGVQKRLIGHSCTYLVDTYRVEEAEDTAFIEMELVDWPKLTNRLANVPDEEIVPLISQLVKAVRFLESKSIVHRDIKPENILISPDYKSLKLLDLGVAREFDSPEDSDLGLTDSGARRPFLATAQYSSPDYLFRLDEPTEKLWHGLNFYQVGAVLHDLIKKEPLFQYEVTLGNRWLVARAVLMKQPSFGDGDIGRLAALKSLAMRCLTKDLNTRLALVGWHDFLLEGPSDPVAALRGRLAGGKVKLVLDAGESAAARLAFDRSDYLRRIAERVRAEMISACDTQLPLTMRCSTGNPATIELEFAVSGQIEIRSVLRFEWGSQIYERTAKVEISAHLACAEFAAGQVSYRSKPVAEVSIQVAEDEAVLLMTSEIARVVGAGLDRATVVGASYESLHAADLLT